MPVIVATTFAKQPSATHQGSARSLLGTIIPTNTTTSDPYYTYSLVTVCIAKSNTNMYFMPHISEIKLFNTKYTATLTFMFHADIDY